MRFLKQKSVSQLSLNFPVGLHLSRNNCLHFPIEATTKEAKFCGQLIENVQIGSSLSSSEVGG